jgi:hypothetical protein
MVVVPVMPHRVAARVSADNVRRAGHSLAADPRRRGAGGECEQRSWQRGQEEGPGLPEESQATLHQQTRHAGLLNAEYG